MTKSELIDRWKDYRKSIINPDDLSWEDLGFDSPPSKLKSIDDYLEEEIDERSQAEIQMVDLFLEDLEQLEA